MDFLNFPPELKAPSDQGPPTSSLRVEVHPKGLNPAATAAPTPPVRAKEAASDCGPPPVRPAPVQGPEATSDVPRKSDGSAQPSRMLPWLWHWPMRLTTGVDKLA